MFSTILVALSVFNPPQLPFESLIPTLRQYIPDPRRYWGGPQRREPFSMTERLTEIAYFDKRNAEWRYHWRRYKNALAEGDLDLAVWEREVIWLKNPDNFRQSNELVWLEMRANRYERCLDILRPLVAQRMPLRYYYVSADASDVLFHTSPLSRDSNLTTDEYEAYVLYASVCRRLGLQEEESRLHDWMDQRWEETTTSRQWDTPYPSTHPDAQ